MLYDSRGVAQSSLGSLVSWVRVGVRREEFDALVAALERIDRFQVFA